MMSNHTSTSQSQRFVFFLFWHFYYSYFQVLNLI
jgi:hypothetical protein